MVLIPYLWSIDHRVVLPYVPMGWCGEDYILLPLGREFCN